MRALVSEYDFTVANTLPEALHLLSSGEGWRPMAGGTDIMVVFNSGRLSFHRFVGIGNLPELRDIHVSEGHVSMGAAVTYTEIRHHPTLQAEFPLLCQAAGWTGGTANQNRGTLGGNIANASPAADSAPMLLAYDAEVELMSTSGVRWLPYAGFHVAYKLMQLRPDELISHIRLPRAKQQRLQYARKVGGRKAQAISKVCFAACGERVDSSLHNVRIAVGSVAPTPLRCYQTEAVLQGQRLSATTIAQAKATLAREIQPITDIRSTDQYRAKVTVNLLADFLESAR